jgi:hypothetical protein
MNRPHENDARFVHRFILKVTNDSNSSCDLSENSKGHGFDPILAGCALHTSGRHL